MKKFFALSLAVAMVLSLASVAFAADERYSIEGMSGNYYKVKSKQVYIDSTSVDPTVNYGNTIYYPLEGATWTKANVYVTGSYGEVVKYDAVKGVKIATDWSVGGDWVTKVEIVKKRNDAPSAGDYIYYLAVTFKGAPTKTEDTDVIGEVTFKKSSGDNKINRDTAQGWSNSKSGETAAFPIDVTLKYAAPTAGKENEIPDGSRKFVFGDPDKGEIDEDEEYEFTFAKWSDATFTVNTVGQGSIVLKATTDYNADIAALYPEANLDFFIGNGAVFNKTGTMFIPAEEGSFIYEIKNGALAAVKGAEYDEYDEGFYFKTRTLGQYVVSDVELDLAASVVTPDDGGISVVDPTAPTTPVNPGTGAAA